MAPGGLIAQFRYAWQTRQLFAVADDFSRLQQEASRLLEVASTIPQQLLGPGWDVRRGWHPGDPTSATRIVRRLLAAPATPPTLRNACGTQISLLLRAAPDLLSPAPLGGLLHLLLDLYAQDPAAGRWQASIDSCAIQLLRSQDTAGTWTSKAGDAVACTAAIQAGWALERLAHLRGGDAKLERAVSMAADWAFSKQKTNGYFYSCTWSADPSTNPLTTELIDTAEGLLALGLLRDQKHYRAAGLLTARHLMQRVPAGQLSAGAWTSEWNPERHRSPLATLRLAELCDLAVTAPSPEQLSTNFAAAASQLRATVAPPPFVRGYGLPPHTGGLPMTIPALGRPWPFTISTEATACWLTSARIGA